MRQHPFSPVSISNISFLFNAAFGQLLIPQPSGKYDVAYSTARLVDEGRVDPFDPKGGKRNLMVSLFYPIEPQNCEEICAIDYMPPATAAFVEAQEFEMFGLTLPGAILGSVKLQVCCKPNGSTPTNVRKFPLVFFSPGAGGTRTMYGAVAQELASAGYAVLTMDHTFDSMIVEYPDGTSVLGPNASWWDPAHLDRFDLALNVRIEDAKSLLNLLCSKTVVQKLVPGAATGFNTEHVAFYGHSYGGATAVATLMADKRIVAAINLDGAQYIGNQTHLADTQRPVLLFGRADPSSHNITNDASWPPTWDHLKGWRGEIGLRDSRHLTFADFALLFKMAKIPTTNATTEFIGELDGERSFSVITAYVQAFMDFVWKGKPDKLFEGPSAEYPEVVVD